MAKFEVTYAPHDADDEGVVNMFREPEVMYIVRRPDVSFAAFHKLSETLGFTQQEWGSILHISDRTLQRYLKEGKPFTDMHAEVLFFLQKLVDAGLQVFENNREFVAWLRTPKQVLGHALAFDALHSISGIKLLHDELGRMAYGVYI